MQVHFLFLLPMAFLLPPGTWAGEIIGGHDAKSHSRRYMAFLEIQEGAKYSHCGGFLVAEDFVLTAAHCQGDFSSRITVVLGAHDLTTGKGMKQVIPKKGQIPHPQYNRKTLKNDIMLLELSREVPGNKEICIIELPEANEELEAGTQCSVAGWGKLSPDAEDCPDTLQEVDVEVMPNETCPSYPDWLYSDFDPSTMMCVGNFAERNDSAEGDSGGPLVCGQKAHGIVSWGPCKPPGVYTKISAFVPWIKKTMKRRRDRPRLRIPAQTRAAPLDCFGSTLMSGGFPGGDEPTPLS